MRFGWNCYFWYWLKLMSRKTHHYWSAKIPVHRFINTCDTKAVNEVRKYGQNVYFEILMNVMIGPSCRKGQLLTGEIRIIPPVHPSSTEFPSIYILSWTEILIRTESDGWSKLWGDWLTCFPACRLLIFGEGVTYL